MDQINEEIINQPATEEYSFNFGGGVFGDYAPDQKTHMYELIATEKSPDEVLMDLDMPENHLRKIEYKVNIGETLETAVRRVLVDNLGILEVFNLEHRFSKSNLKLVYVRAICRNSRSVERKPKGLNLYWYGIS